MYKNKIARFDVHLIALVIALLKLSDTWGHLWPILITFMREDPANFSENQTLTFRYI